MAYPSRVGARGAFLGVNRGQEIFNDFLARSSNLTMSEKNQLRPLFIEVFNNGFSLGTREIHSNVTSERWPVLVDSQGREILPFCADNGLTVLSSSLRDAISYVRRVLGKDTSLPIGVVRAGGEGHSSVRVDGEDLFVTAPSSELASRISDVMRAMMGRGMSASVADVPPPPSSFSPYRGSEGGERGASRESSSFSRPVVRGSAVAGRGECSVTINAGRRTFVHGTPTPSSSAASAVNNGFRPEDLVGAMYIQYFPKNGSFSGNFPLRVLLKEGTVLAKDAEVVLLERTENGLYRHGSYDSDVPVDASWSATVVLNLANVYGYLPEIRTIPLV